jgi:hypothetical protein
VLRIEILFTFGKKFNVNMTTIAFQFSDLIQLQQVLGLAKRLNIPFKLIESPNSTEITWHWDDTQAATYELSLSAFAQDWESEADKIWDNV